MAKDWTPEQRARYNANRNRWRKEQIAKDPEAFYAAQRARVNAQRAQKMRDDPVKEMRRRRTNVMKYNYGITLVEYEAMVEAVGNRCESCKRHHDELPPGKYFDTRLYVDHCHKTKEVRGILCFTCNVAMGLVQDNPAMLRSAAEYLERHQAPRP